MRRRGPNELRIVFLDGPGDTITSFRYWRQGQDNPNTTGVPFSNQLFDACSELKARVLVIGEHQRQERIEDGDFVIEHRGNATRGKSGASYHLAELRHAARIFKDIVRFRPHIAIVPARPYPFLLCGLRLLGIRSVMNLHCVLWRKYRTPRGVRRLLHALDGLYFRHGCDAVLCVSEDIKRQVRDLAGRRCPPFVDFLPLFRRNLFDDIPPAAHERRPFRVLFVGRIERFKGVFDLLEIARRMRARGRGDIIFELCGDGTRMGELRRRVASEGLEEAFVLHGWCDQSVMRQCLGRSHAAIVPTTTEFIEGFNMAIVEALLAQRPVVSSPVCPAVEYLKDAVVSVAPDDVDGYEEAILKLADDRAYYEGLRGRCAAVAERFLDASTSYHAALRHSLAAIVRGQPVTPKEIPVKPLYERSLQFTAGDGRRLFNVARTGSSAELVKTKPN